MIYNYFNLFCSVISTPCIIFVKNFNQMDNQRKEKILKIKQRIKEVLKIKGISMNELADKLEINRVNLSASLSGNPTIETLIKIADVLEVQVSELIVNQSDKNEVSGYLEFRGEIHKIETITDVETFVYKVKSNLNNQK